MLCLVYQIINYLKNIFQKLCWPRANLQVLNTNTYHLSQAYNKHRSWGQAQDSISMQPVTQQHNTCHGLAQHTTLQLHATCHTTMQHTRHELQQQTCRSIAQTQCIKPQDNLKPKITSKDGIDGSDQGKNNAYFLCLFMLGKLEECIQCLVDNNRIVLQ